MERLKKVGKVVGVIVLVLLVAGGSGYAWASWKSASMMEVTYEAHDVDFPVPFPLTEEELAALRAERTPPAAPDAANADAADAANAEDPGAEGVVVAAPPAAPPADPLEGVDLAALALERAVARGRHLVEARYACIECHGDDFGGGTMIDDPMIGSLYGPNLTGGEGSRVTDWTVAEWDRAVRHGILPGGRPSAMPAEDYQRMSDQELSDVIAYVRSFPAVDRRMPPISLGPLGTVLMATGQLPLSVTRIAEHDRAHPVAPPEAAPTVEFGEHLAGVCTGCHREDMRGGPIPAAPPDWLAAANLTPHADGLAGWSYEDFRTAMREFRRPDGTELGLPMSLMRRYISNMSDVELEAMWAYLQSLQPQPTGT
ncbi:MAG: c-type cytochrome [Sandaracinaceae bacterium]|nr:c-type cytochrome [Sandaracinaceae bacterium]